jgi:hypothetical protein
MMKPTPDEAEHFVCLSDETLDRMLDEVSRHLSANRRRSWRLGRPLHETNRDRRNHFDVCGRAASENFVD